MAPPSTTPASPARANAASSPSLSTSPPPASAALPRHPEEHRSICHCHLRTTSVSSPASLLSRARLPTLNQSNRPLLHSRGHHSSDPPSGTDAPLKAYSSSARTKSGQHSGLSWSNRAQDADGLWSQQGWRRGQWRGLFWTLSSLLVISIGMTLLVTRVTARPPSLSLQSVPMLPAPHDKRSGGDNGSLRFGTHEVTIDAGAFDIAAARAEIASRSNSITATTNGESKKNDNNPEQHGNQKHKDDSFPSLLSVRAVDVYSARSDGDPLEALPLPLDDSLALSFPGRAVKPAPESQHSGRLMMLAPTSRASSSLADSDKSAVKPEIDDGATPCQRHLRRLLRTPQMKTCYPFSLLLQGSSTFFEAERAGAAAVRRVLEVSCAADVDMCATFMRRAAADLVKPANCRAELESGSNSAVRFAVNGLRAYREIYHASCLRMVDDGDDAPGQGTRGGALSPAMMAAGLLNQTRMSVNGTASMVFLSKGYGTRTNATAGLGAGVSGAGGNANGSTGKAADEYCFAAAVSSPAKASDAYLFLLPLNLTLPSTAQPSCNSCVRRVMEVYRAASADRGLSIATRYEGAARVVNECCGAGFVDETLPRAVKSDGVRSRGEAREPWAVLTVTIMVVMLMVVV